MVNFINKSTKTYIQITSHYRTTVIQYEIKALIVTITCMGKKNKIHEHIKLKCLFELLLITRVV